VARTLGRLSSLKQFSLERHVLLYGTSAKNNAAITNNTNNSSSSNGGKGEQSTLSVLPEAGLVVKESNRLPPVGVVRASAVKRNETIRLTLGVRDCVVVNEC